MPRLKENALLKYAMKETLEWTGIWQRRITLEGHADRFHDDGFLTL
jgi:hypothetical protein